MARAHASSILILGATGYIGKFFLAHARDRYTIVALTRNQEIAVDHDADSDVIWIHGLDHDLSGLSDILRKYHPAKIINFVGVGKAPSEQQNRFDYFYASNCQVTIHLLEAMRSIQDYHPKVVLVGSGAEYGLAQDFDSCVRSEESPARPGSWYGLTKTIQTDIGQYYARVYMQRVNIVRLSNVIGPQMKLGFFLSDTLQKIKGGLLEVDIADDQSVRDFIFIDDAVVALNKVLDLSCSGEIINVSSGKGVVLAEILATIAEQLCKKLNRSIFFKKKEINSTPPTFSVLANKKLIALTDFKPATNVHEMVSRILGEEFRVGAP